jgi:undecaprenyl-diphosphatase
VIIASVLFVVLTVAVAARVSVPTDRAIFLFLHRYGENSLGGAAGVLASRTLEFVGAATVLAIFLALIAMGRFRVAALLAACFVPLALKPALHVTPALSGAFERRQPPDVHPSVNWSYPSGHATGSMAFAAFAVALGWTTRWRGLILLSAGIFVGAVGMAAVISSEHWPSDVVAGWALVYAWVGALCWLSRGMTSTDGSA